MTEFESTYHETVSKISELSNAELDEELERAAIMNEKSEMLVCCFLAAVRERRAFIDFGYSNIYDYAHARFAFGARKTRYLVSLGLKVERLPKIREALASGKIGWCKASRVASVATPQNEVMWLDSALSLTVQQLERRIRDGTDSLASAVHFVLTEDRRILWEHALEIYRRRAGAEISPVEAFELMCAEVVASAPRAPMPEHIPWAYGRTRVGALPVDPDRVFVYWEVTDEGIEEARRALGPGANDAWLNLRVYDTTGRLFDGTNAHSYFDQGIGNETRQWFFDIGRPGSEAFVEIGLRSPDGGFRKVARSRRVAFPRRSPASYPEPEWLTVRASSVGEPVVTHSSRAPLASTSASGMPERELRAAPGRQADAGWNASERIFHSYLGPSTVVERRIELSEERIETVWQGPVSTTEWESEPFSFSLDVLYGDGPVWETYAGETRTFQVDGRTHVVFGPWQVVVRGIGAHGGRRVLSRWTVYRSWAVEGQGELLSTGVWSRMLGSSALLGGSERRLGGASELRLSGASELLYRGASERRLGGASERLYAAASERLMRGASERRFRGASERRLGGASERVYAAASEKLMRGASDKRFAGASERFPSPTRSTGPDEGGNR